MSNEWMEGLSAVMEARELIKNLKKAKEELNQLEIEYAELYPAEERTPPPPPHSKRNPIDELDELHRKMEEEIVRRPHLKADIQKYYGQLMDDVRRNS